MDDLRGLREDAVGFEEYATRQLPVLLRTAQAISGDVHLAEDLVQDVLIKVHAGWPVISQVDAPDAYVRRMLINEFLSWRRKWGRLIPRPDPAAQLVGEGDPAHAVAERDALLREIARLPGRQRLVIALRYVADMPDVEIAATLGCSQSTVRVHAFRALAALRVGRSQPETFQLVERGTS